MKNVMLVSPNRADATSFYRGYGPWGALRKDLPQNVNLVSWPGNLDWSTLKMVDVVFLQRPFNTDHLKIAEMAKERGKKLIVDYDDDLFHVPDDNPAHALYESAVNKANIVKILGHADAVIASTNFLRGILAKAMPGPYQDATWNKTVVIPNAFDDFDFTFREKRGKVKEPTNCVLWRGSATHMRDLSDYAAEIIQAHQENPNWIFTFIGYHPWFISQAFKKENYVHSRALDVYEYFKTIHEMYPSAVIVPLFRSAFNLCKSNIAWIEASFAGAVTVCPNWEEWQKPGALNFNDQREFLNSLNAVLRGEVDVKARAEESWQYIQDNLLLSKVNKKRLEVLMGVLG